MSECVKEIQFKTKFKRTQEEKNKGNELLQKRQKEDAKPVTGIFKNLEVPGGDLEFAYRIYAGEPIQVYYLKDGEKYTIPLGVAKHLNNQTRVPLHENLVDSKGVRMPQTQIGKYKQRYQFLSTEYM